MQSAVGSGPRYGGGVGRKIEKAQRLPSGPPPAPAVQEAPTHPGLAPGCPGPTELRLGPPVYAQQVPKAGDEGSGQNLFPIPPVR